MNIEYTKETILNLISKIIQNDFKSCELKSESLIKKEYKFEYTSSRFMFSRNTNALYWNFVIPSDASVKVEFLPSNELIILEYLMFDNREIIISIKHKEEEKRIKNIVSKQFKSWYQKKYFYNLIESILVPQYEIVIERKQTGRTQYIDISEIEYLNIIQSYHTAVEKYNFENEEKLIQENKRMIDHYLEKLMDKYNVEKQIE